MPIRISCLELQACLKAKKFYYASYFQCQKQKAKHKKVVPILCMETWAWFKAFFCFQSRIIDIESRRLFLPWPHFEFPSFVLGVINMAKINFSCFWHSTFNLESRRLNVQKNCSNYVHGNLGMVQSNFFVLGLLLSTPKVGGKEQLFLPWSHFAFLSLMLGV